MKQIIKTVGQIMEDLRVFTNWNFAGGMKGDTCIINAPLVNEQGKKVDVTLEFYKTDVLIKVTAWNDCFDREKVEQTVGRLEISVETELNEASFIISHHEPLGVLEHSVKGVLEAMHHTYGGRGSRVGCRIENRTYLRGLLIS